MTGKEQITEELQLLNTQTYLYVTFLDDSTFEGYLKNSTEKYLILALNVMEPRTYFIPFEKIKYFSAKSQELES